MCQVPAKKVATPTKDSTAAMAELQDDIGDVLEGKGRSDKNLWEDMKSSYGHCRSSPYLLYVFE